MNVAERMVGRKEHDVHMKANEYITKNFDDVWAAVVRLHVMILAVMVILAKKSDR